MKHVKKILGLLFSTMIFFSYNGNAQDQKKADSLYHIYQQTIIDTSKFQLLVDLSFNEVRELNLALKVSEQLISLSKQANNTKYLRAGYFIKGTKERLLGNLNGALSDFIKSAELAKKMNKPTAEADSYSAMADVYSASNNSVTAQHYYDMAIKLLRQSKDSVNLASTLLNAGDDFQKNKVYDTALLYFNESKIICDKINYTIGRGYCFGNIGMVYAGLGKNDLAEKNINEAIKILQETEDRYPVCDYLISLADVYAHKNDLRTAIRYALQSLQFAELNKLVLQIANANFKLSELYEKSGNNTISFKYYKDFIFFRDSLNNIASVQKLADLTVTYEVSQKQAEVNLLNEQKTNQRNLLILLGVILGLTIIILMIAMRINKHKQDAYEILEKQKQETEAQKLKAEDAFKELQITQNQLIQREKMASLGELTAGIAHEIQNPLNFVNNFSEVNSDLVDEINKETDINEIKAIANDIKLNNEKITFHGKRADAIVKGMLQHSKKSSGQKEATNINKLSEEYLRLSYHGLVMKDKFFNADFKTDFDESIGTINIIPQDIGRVLLNLYNNAFYATNEKFKARDLLHENYKPLVTVETKLLTSQDKKSEAVIMVSDNGSGIPAHIIDKVFQPFFTTKPTGQGTGLGLSLAYDIITKEHNGTIKVESKEGEGTTFIIMLPFN